MFTITIKRQESTQNYRADYLQPFFNGRGKKNGEFDGECPCELS